MKSNPLRDSTLRWLLAVLLTVPFLAFQRRTGPTYPVRGKVELGGASVSYRLPRSASVGADAVVRISVPDTSICGSLSYRRYKSLDAWAETALRREGEFLVGELPEQPPAGKVMYTVTLRKESQTVTLPMQPVVLRFKGKVPVAVLVPHVLFITLAMLFSTRAGVEALARAGQPRRFMLWTIGLFLVGGFILGPVVQKLAFGAFWTGFPFGHDLTDNKTLVAMLGWVAAWKATAGGRKRRGWVIGAALLMVVVYLIPHSLLGSEIDFTSTGPGR
ncbi:MAG: hypothetical protein ONB25_07170 [candidate division KSB1 bacterium]|nr:hypothetical protein [candidate division KSB1 bacterium]